MFPQNDIYLLVLDFILKTALLLAKKNYLPNLLI